MAKKKKPEPKLPTELAQLFDDEVQQDAMLPLVMEEDTFTEVYRSIWRRIFTKTIPPWIITEKNKEKLEDPGPYAVPALLTGELCLVCDRPLYLTSNQNGITCVGGHSEEQRKKTAEKLLDGDGEYATFEPSEDLEYGDDDDGFFD